MKREVAELSGNFRGELSSLDGGEGIRLIFALCATILLIFCTNSLSIRTKNKKISRSFYEKLLNYFYNNSLE